MRSLFQIADDKNFFLIYEKRWMKRLKKKFNRIKEMNKTKIMKQK